MKKLLFAFVCLAAMILCGCQKDDSPITPGQAGDLTRVIETYTITPDEIIEDVAARFGDVLKGKEDLLKLLINKNFTVTKIAYLTPSPEGGLSEASGIIAYSAGQKTFSRITSIQHGTCDIDDAPSLQKFSVELAPVLKEGSVAILADYLGYGTSRTQELQTPYLHTYYTGTACADMLKAAETYLKDNSSILGIIYTGKEPIDLIGYSQGGAASISTLFELQKRGYTERISEVWAGAGPYDLPAFLEEFRGKAGKDYISSGNIPFLIRGISYGEQLVLDAGKIYAPEIIDKGIDKLFSTTQLSTWHSILGSDVTKILSRDFFTDGYNGNRDILKFIKAAAENSTVSTSVYGDFGHPINPERVTLYHEQFDDQVPYSCAQIASEIWGCRLVTLDTPTIHPMGALEFYARYLGLWSIIRPFVLIY